MNTVGQKASVVIPIFNRADAIGLTLEALERQTMEPTDFEVIVVDDGSSDASAEIVENLSVSYHLELIRQDNSGAGAARNKGARIALAPLLIFLDADMIAAPDLVEQYLAAHTAYPQALVIGRQNPWADAYQSIFDRVTDCESFRDLRSEPFEPEFYHVLSSSMALSKDWFMHLNGFNCSVGIGTQPATDDTEFGYRAQQAGLDLVYWPAALAYHNHPRTFAQRCKQAYVTAYWTAKLFQRYPEIRGEIPAFREVAPFDRTDDISLLTKKVKRKVVSLDLLLPMLNLVIQKLEHWWPQCPFLASCYWAVLGAHRYRGFQAGSREIDG